MTRPTRLPALSNRPDLGLLKRLVLVKTICIAVVGLVAGAVLFGWWIPDLAARLPAGWSLMKANSAAGMLLCAMSLAFSRIEDQPWRVGLSRISAIGPILIGMLVLLEYLNVQTIGIDTLLAADSVSATPGRISVQTSLYLLLMGLSLLFSRADRGIRSHAADTLTMSVVVLTLVVFAGYFFGPTHLFGNNAYTRTSPQTMLCMLLLALVLVGRRTGHGWFSVLVGMGAGSRIARAVLPYAVVLPFLLIVGGAYITLMGWLSAPYAAALTAAITAVALFTVTVVLAWRINDLERNLQDLSLTDELTGVLNRRGFNLLGEQALRDARRSKTPLTVMFFDLDGLKQTNDSFGHDVGSQFLVDVAGLLGASFRDADVVARIGGDEFAVIAHCDHTDARMAQQRLDERAAALNRTGNRSYRISYSVGEASFDSLGEDTFEMLVARADAVMYQRKRSKNLLQ